MSELTREIIPIVVMYGFVLLLAPFIGFAMWVAFDGDRLVEPAADEEAATVAPLATAKPTTSREPGEAFGAA